MKHKALQSADFCRRYGIEIIIRDYYTDENSSATSSLFSRPPDVYNFYLRRGDTGIVFYNKRINGTLENMSAYFILSELDLFKTLSSAPITTEDSVVYSFFSDCVEDLKKLLSTQEEPCLKE